MNTRELANAISERLLTAGCTSCPSLSSQVVDASVVEDPDKDGTWGVQIRTLEGDQFFVHVEPESALTHYPNGLDDPQPYAD